MPFLPVAEEKVVHECKTLTMFIEYCSVSDKINSQCTTTGELHVVTAELTLVIAQMMLQTQVLSRLAVP